MQTSFEQVYADATATIDSNPMFSRKKQKRPSSKYSSGRPSTAVGPRKQHVRPSTAVNRQFTTQNSNRVSGAFSAKSSVRPNLKRPSTGVDKRTCNQKKDGNLIRQNFSRVPSAKRNSKSKKRSLSGKKDSRRDGSRKPKNDSTERSTFRNEKLVGVERPVLTPLTDDGIYYILEPTLSQDHGPNYKEKIYNDVRLNYKKDKGNRNKFFNFAEAKCVINIPHMVKIDNRKKRRRRAQVDTSVYQSTSRLSTKKNSPGRKSSPGRSPRRSPGRRNTQSNQNTHIQVTDEANPGAKFNVNSPQTLAQTIATDDDQQQKSKFVLPGGMEQNSSISPRKFEDIRSQTENTDKDQDEDDEEPVPTSNKLKEYSLPIKFVIKQRDFVIGKEFKQQEKLDIYVSQNTENPGPDLWGGKQMHSVMHFNVKSKFNYDKEFGSNQVYQFIFGQEHLELLNQERKREAHELLLANVDMTQEKKMNQRNIPTKKIIEREVKFPNHVYITIRSLRKCDLDIAVQLTLQPEKMEDDKVLMQQLQKSKQRIDIEMAERIEEELLKYYMQNERTFGALNYVKENMRTAENAPTMDMKQRIYQHNNQVHMLKSAEAMNKKSEMLQWHQQQIMDKMTKWDRYRQARENAIDQYVKLFFRMKKVALLIALVQTQQVISKVCDDFKLWQEHNRYNLNKLFLAIKFKIRFRERFYKKYGRQFDQRINKYMIRHFSICAPVFQEVRSHKAKKIVDRFLFKYDVTTITISKFRGFYRNMLEMQRLIRKVIMNRTLRQALTQQKFDREVEYLLWYFKREYKNSRGPKDKKEINFYIDRLEQGKISTDIQEQKVYILKRFAEICMCEHMLDYVLWIYVKNEKEIEQKEKTMDKDDLEEDENYQQLITKRKNFINKMKFWRVRIFNLKQEVFDNTEVVDDRDLYIIDYAGYNEAHPRRMKAQNNDDLQIVSREGSDSSPSPTRAQIAPSSGPPKKGRSSAAKNTSKGKKKGSKKKKTTGKGISQTFTHLKDQEKLVVYIVQQQENREVEESLRKELTPVQKLEMDGLLFNYKQIGLEFPAFNIKSTRENMQRLVVKVMGLC